MTESEPPDNSKQMSRRFRNLYHYRHFERRSATWALLALGNTRHFALEIDFGGYRVSADRTVSQSLNVFFQQCFHDAIPSIRPTQSKGQRLSEFGKKS
jgi:hypothetical protein